MKIRILAVIILLATLMTVLRTVIAEAFHWKEDASILAEVVLAILIFALNELIVFLSLERKKKEQEATMTDLRHCFPKFIDDFGDYCIECKRAIEGAHEGAEIYTIQTPLYIEETAHGEDHFEYYMNKTGYQLLQKENSSDLNALKIRSYKRLIVINDTSDSKEIEAEKGKLEYLLKAIKDEYSNYSGKWRPNLKNIHIGLVNSKDIYNSPFSNLDILLIKDQHIVFAFPTENHHSYIWGTSIHIEHSEHYDISSQFEKFKIIYNNLWDKESVIKINFNDGFETDNIGHTIDNIRKQINIAFDQLMAKKSKDATGI